MTENELQDLRRAKLVAYVDSAGGAAKVGRDKNLPRSWESQYAQIKGGSSFGSRAARNLEEKLKVPPMFFEPAAVRMAHHIDMGAVHTNEARLLSLADDDIENGNLEAAPTLRSSRPIPVVGEVKGGDDGFLEELQYPVGHGEGHVDYQTTDPAAYALRVRGDSMHPRYRAGEFIVVEPGIEPQLGEDVVVALKDGRKLLKELNWMRDGEVQLLSINNHFGPLTIPLAEVSSIQLVAGRVRRSAFHKS